MTHWFQEVARFLGPAYLRYSFTKGTEQEVAFLWGALELSEGSRVLDVGCGPGRHALALARRGASVVGVDISDDFVRLASEAVSAEGLTTCRFEVADARHLTFDGEFDAVVSLCQGGFGLPDPPDSGGDDLAVFDGLVRALRPGGRLALSAFSAYFAVRFLEEGESFDAGSGVHSEVMTVKDPDGRERTFDGWTSCWTPRELRLLAARAGLDDVSIHGVSPGSYGDAAPGLDVPEFLLLARTPTRGPRGFPSPGMAQ